MLRSTSGGVCASSTFDGPWGAVAASTEGSDGLAPDAEAGDEVSGGAGGSAEAPPLSSSLAQAATTRLIMARKAAMVQALISRGTRRVVVGFPSRHPGKSIEGPAEADPAQDVTIPGRRSLADMVAG